MKYRYDIEKGRWEARPGRILEGLDSDILILSLSDLVQFSLDNLSIPFSHAPMPYSNSSSTP